jgi:hypothetical protein
MDGTEMTPPRQFCSRACSSAQNSADHVRYLQLAGRHRMCVNCRQLFRAPRRTKYCGQRCLRAWKSFEYRRRMEFGRAIAEGRA